MSGLELAVVGIGALGCWLIARGVPVLRRPRLEMRLAPYLRDTPRPSRLLAEQQASSPFPVLERLLRPILADLAGRLDRVIGGAVSVRRRLDAAGLDISVPAFRGEQLLWGAAGLGGGLGLALLAAVRRSSASPAGLAVLAVTLGVAGLIARDRWLTRQVRVREERITAEFPTVAELLALAVAAGEGPAAALERVTRTCSGELSRELARALADTHAGASLSAALDAIAARTTLPSLARFADGIAVAIERGTPLAEVLRAQAADVREAGRRALLDSGGKREIAMMIPVVFFVLPLTIVFALFPGFYGFTLKT